MYKASVYTLGCRVNQYESDAVEEGLHKYGFVSVPHGTECDVAIINTCTVTAESDRKSRQLIRRAASCAKAVIVTGCYSQSAGEIDGVTLVVSNSEKNRIPRLAAELVGAAVPYSGCDGELSISSPKRARCHIKIEDGCENKCAYCIIPSVRGAVRSKAPEAVLTEARAIAATGCREIILTGIETASYGADSDGWDLARLIEALDGIPGIERIGTGSLDPSVMREDFVRRLTDARHLLPHFHLSVQSGCSATLSRMRRKYNAEQAAENIMRVRRYIPEATFSADIIVGFPGESENDFLETEKFCRDADFLHLHIFPYSRRGGTEAATLGGQIPESEKKRRAAELAKAGDDIRRAQFERYIASHADKPVYVLGEKWENGVTNGHTEHFIECDIITDFDTAGKILPVIPYGYDGAVLKGKIYAECNQCN